MAMEPMPPSFNERSLLDPVPIPAPSIVAVGEPFRLMLALLMEMSLALPSPAPIIAAYETKLSPGFYGPGA